MPNFCICGREITSPRPHCPFCGSKFVAAKRSAGRIVMEDNRVVARLAGFRCRACDSDFSEGDECRAPAPIFSKKNLMQSRLARSGNVVSVDYDEQTKEILNAAQKTLAELSGRSDSGQSDSPTTTTIEHNIDNDPGPEV
jgi:transposase-like protein